MKVWNIGIIGFGNVGQGFVNILLRKRNSLRERFGFEFRILGISDIIKGSVFDEQGLDLKTVLDIASKYGDIKNYPRGRKDIDSIWLAENERVDLVVEVTWTNIETGEPGLTHIKTALENGKHVVTSNKGPIALAYPELIKLAAEKDVLLRFEATVLSGTPAINLALESLSGVDINRIQGVVNGTTNYILTKMEEGLSYDDALKKSQELGYAEADPTADVDGWDAAVKAVILADVVMNGKISIKNVYRKGIRGFSMEEVSNAVKNNKRIKLIAEVLKENGHVKASVSPREIPRTNPLANIMGAMNALTFYTDHLGEITIIGPGAGRVEAGQGILNDILAVHRMRKQIQ